MKLSRKQLRMILLREMNDNAAAIKNLNYLISVAKQQEKEARAASGEIYYDHPSDDWDYIEFLVSSLGFDVNPPKSLSIFSVVDDDGEILKSYLTYDQAMKYIQNNQLIFLGVNRRYIDTMYQD